MYLVEHLATNQQYAAKMIHFPKQDKNKDKKKHRVTSVTRIDFDLLNITGHDIK